MGPAAVGQRLRALRAANGRTVASVAADAGLSVPYVANLENGRGNPTLAVLGRLAATLGTRLSVDFVTAQTGTTGATRAAPELPATLTRFSRTAGFRHAVVELAQATGADQTELAGQVLDVLVRLSAIAGRQLSEPDWFRLLDALLLVTLHPRPEK